MIQTFSQTLPHGITLSCRAAGEPGRPMLLFLHGFPEAAFVWDELLLHFSRPEHGSYHCVAPNLRGFERSSAPTDTSAYRAKPLLQDLGALIVALTQESPTPGQLAGLIAHDWGGALAGALPPNSLRLCGNWSSSTHLTPRPSSASWRNLPRNRRPART